VVVDTSTAREQQLELGAIGRAVRQSVSVVREVGAVLSPLPGDGEGTGMCRRGDVESDDDGDDRHWTCGDRGVSEWTIRGTRATGETIEVRGCDLFEITDDKDQSQGRLLKDRRLKRLSHPCDPAPRDPVRAES